MSQFVIDTLDDFADAIRTGLSQTQKGIAARFFYDRRGSELFEAITELPEYYPTRTERAILQAHAADIARLAGRERPVVEFGAGSATKTPLMLDAVRPPAYVPIDVSEDFLVESAAAIAARYPAMRVCPVVGDFAAPLALPDLVGPLIGFFPGSTIGNSSHPAAARLLRSFRTMLRPDARLVIGFDLRKNPRLLEAAYDDAAGVTAEFNLNLLHRINRELGADIPVDAFEHRAVWHDGFGRIEMHLVAQRDLSFHVAGETFAMREGETIHTENSYKYTIEETRLLARVAGWEPMAAWSDKEDFFSVQVWASAEESAAP